MTEQVNGGVGGRVEVKKGKGCSRLFLEFSSSFRGIQSFSLEPMFQLQLSVIYEHPVKSHGPLSGLVICVTGLSRETRKQVKEATRDWEVNIVLIMLNAHIWWFKVFVDINLSMLSNKGAQNDYLARIDKNFVAENGCLPAGLLNHSTQLDKIEGPLLRFPERETKRPTVLSSCSGQSFYIDVDASAELHHRCYTEPMVCWLQRKSCNMWKGLQF